MRIAFFFKWIDGPNKFDTRYLVLIIGGEIDGAHECFEWWFPPPMTPPMMNEGKSKATNKCIETPPSMITAIHLHLVVRLSLIVVTRTN